MTTSNVVYGYEYYNSKNSLMTLYEMFLDLWIKPLRSNVPARTRVNIEKRLRGISMQLYLSCQGLQCGLHSYEQDRQVDLANVDHDEFDLPLRRKASTISLSTKGKEIVRESSPPQPIEMGSQDYLLNLPRMLPTPEPTPSLHSQHSASSLASTKSTLPHQRLQALALIEPQPALSDSLTQLLGHWSLGEDPIRYNWSETQRLVDTPSDAEEIRLRRQQRLEKRLKRHRQQSLGESSQQSSAWLLSSQPLTSQTLREATQIVEQPLSHLHFEQATKNVNNPKRRKSERKKGF